MFSVCDSTKTTCTKTAWSPSNIETFLYLFPWLSVVWHCLLRSPLCYDESLFKLVKSGNLPNLILITIKDWMTNSWPKSRTSYTVKGAVWCRFCCTTSHSKKSNFFNSRGRPGIGQRFPFAKQHSSSTPLFIDEWKNKSISIHVPQWKSMPNRYKHANIQSKCEAKPLKNHYASHQVSQRMLFSDLDIMRHLGTEHPRWIVSCCEDW